MEYSDYQMSIFKDRYALAGEDHPDEMYMRVATAAAVNEETDKWVGLFYDMMQDGSFTPGGRILQAIGNPAQVTAMNCYVIPSPHDSKPGIMKSLDEWVEIQARGGGVGINMSSLRPRGWPVKGVDGTSSGPVTWAQMFAFVSHDVIIQGGSRRGAAMIMLNDHHPDIMEFITAKRQMGFLEGANISVAVSDQFMSAVAMDSDWDLWWRDEHSATHLTGTMKARTIWDAIISSAHASAEPGVVFMERTNRQANSGYFEQLEATNPCAEQALGPYGACLLGSVNIGRIMATSGDGWESHLSATVRTAVRFLDNIIDVANYPLQECMESETSIRRMGIGLMGLADALLERKIRYGSPKAVELTEKIYHTMASAAYRASCDLAMERGPFKHYNARDYWNRPFAAKMKQHIGSINTQHGIRNCYLMTQAPTGTIAEMMGASSGIEPYFDFKYTRSDRMGTSEHESSWANLYYSDERPNWLVTSNDVTPEEHVAMQAAAQKWNDSSISKTVNAPESHTVNDTRRVYEEAYAQGLKSIAYYRDKSRDVQVLNRIESTVTSNNAQSTVFLTTPPSHVPVRTKLDPDRHAHRHTVEIGGVKAILSTGFYPNGQVGELFVDLSKQGSLLQGTIGTVARLISVMLQYHIPIDAITDQLKGHQFEPSGMTGNPEIPRALSLIDYIGLWLDRQNQHKDIIMVDEAALAGMPIAVPTLSGDVCPNCGSLCIRQEGCLKCVRCAWSKC